MITNEQVVEAIKTVIDPDLMLDIYFLGLIYGIQIEEERVDIEMTLTSPMCPAGPMLVEQVKQKVSALGVAQVNVKIVFSPPWEPPEDVRAMLGLI